MHRKRTLTINVNTTFDLRSLIHELALRADAELERRQRIRSQILSEAYRDTIHRDQPKR